MRQAGRDIIFSLSCPGITNAALFSWSFGDSTPTLSASTSTVQHAYAEVGAYAVSVVLSDSQGNVLASPSVTIGVNTGLIEISPVQANPSAGLAKAGETFTDLSAAQLLAGQGIDDPGYNPLRPVSALVATIATAGAVGDFRFRIFDLPVAVGDLRLFGLRPGATSESYAYGSPASLASDGTWWLTDDSGALVPLTATLQANQRYFVNFVIDDNGSFDLDPSSGVIRESLSFGVSGAVPQASASLGGSADTPQAAASAGGSSSDGGGGGGCVAHPAGSHGWELLLLALVALVRLGLASLLRPRRPLG